MSLEPESHFASLVAFIVLSTACGGAPKVDPSPTIETVDAPADCFDRLPDGAIEVVTFNIHAGRDADIAQIGESIRAFDADVVGIQEIDAGTRRTGRVDQPEILRETTGMTVQFVKTMDYQGGSYGLGVASRGAASLTPVRLVEGAEPRTLVITKHTFHGLPLQVATAHLDAPHGDPAQFDSLLTALDEHHPDVLLVDLNATETTTRYAALVELGYQDAWALHPSVPGATFAKDGVDTRIDFVLFSRDFDAVCAEVIDTRLSDHRAVRAALVRNTEVDKE